jgi:hypothetical protein
MPSEKTRGSGDVSRDALNLGRIGAAQQWRQDDEWESLRLAHLSALA